MERFLLRYMYKREELYQLLFTYALVLIFSDACKFIWGTQPHSVSRPPILAGSFDLYGVRFPHYDLFIIAARARSSRSASGCCSTARASAASSAPPRSIARCWARSAPTCRGSILGMFVLAAFLAGLSGALVSPIKSVVPGMDVEIIIEAFIVVVIGGLGSLWGTLLGSLIYGLTLAFGILIFPRFSIFAAFVIMAVVLDRAAVGPVGEARSESEPAQAHPLDAGVVPRSPRFIPVFGSRYYTFLATDIIIFAMFATSLNLLLGVTGLVPFGHAAYFGIGAYVCAIFMKDLGVAVPAAWLARRRRRRAVCGGLRLLLRAPDLGLLLDADHGVRPDRVGHLLQVERRDGRRAGLSQRADAQHGVARVDPVGRRPQDRPQVLLPDADPGGAFDRRHAPHRAFAVRPHAHQPSATMPSAPSSSASTCASTS